MGLWLKTADGIVPVGGGAYMTVTPWTPVVMDVPTDWTQNRQLEWRRVGDRVEFRGLMTRLSTTMPGGGSKAFFIATDNPSLPWPPQKTGIPTGVASTSARTDVLTFFDPDLATPAAYTTASSSTIAVNELVYCDNWSYSLTATGNYPAYTEVPTDWQSEVNTEAKTLSSGVATFTFTNSFASAPTVVVSGVLGDTGNIHVSSVSTTGFQVTCPSLSNQTRTFHWIAFESHP